MTVPAYPSMLVEVLASIASARRINVGTIARAAQRPGSPINKLFAGTGSNKIAAWEWVIFALRAQVDLVPLNRTDDNKTLRVPLRAPMGEVLAKSATVIERAYLAAGKSQNSTPTIDRARDRAFGKAFAEVTLSQWHKVQSLEQAAGMLLQMKDLHAYEATIATGAPQKQLANYYSWVNPAAKVTNVSVPALDHCLRVAGALGYQIQIALSKDAGFVVDIPKEVRQVEGEVERLDAHSGRWSLAKSLISTDEIIGLLNQGMAQVTVGKLAGLSKETIRQIALRHNIPSRNERRAALGHEKAVRFLRKL